VDIHALRHTYATRLARANVPLQKAQKLLGHSDPKLTAEIDAHLEVEDLRADRERLVDLTSLTRPQRISRAAGAEDAPAIVGTNSALDSPAEEDANRRDAVSPAQAEGKAGARGGIRTRNFRFTKAVLCR